MLTSIDDIWKKCSLVNLQHSLMQTACPSGICVTNYCTLQK